MNNNHVKLKRKRNNWTKRKYIKKKESVLLLLLLIWKEVLFYFNFWEINKNKANIIMIISLDMRSIYIYIYI